MASFGPNAHFADDRSLIEAVVTALLAEAPPQWTHLHAVFEPNAHPTVARATVQLPTGGHYPLPIPAEAAHLIGEHQRRAVAAGTPWQRMEINCDSDGRLSAITDSDGRDPARRMSPWPERLLAAVAVCCLIAAGVIFAVSWRWGPPPRAAMISVPEPPVRQVEAFTTVRSWFEAENRGDAGTMRWWACANPAPPVADEIDVIAQQGNVEGITFPEAVVAFRDDGDQVWVRIAVRVHPLSPQMYQDVANARAGGGFMKDQYMLVDEGHGLRICDSDLGAP